MNRATAAKLVRRQITVWFVGLVLAFVYLILSATI
jgi:hypothetical protein